MALKNLMARLQRRAACTPDTADTPHCFADTPDVLQIGLIQALAANDPVQAVGLVTSLVTSEPPEPPPDPNAWRELAAAYHAHHFKCSTCIAAGRGDAYGLRCGTGAALWINYQNT